MEMDNASGIHRAKLWQIGGFALNNTATNLYMVFINYIAYYMVGFVGVGVVLASTIITTMRIWDALTDPIIGYMVDKTNGRFGKNRPFMVIGNIILLVSSFLMIGITHHLPMALRFVFFLLFYMIYIIGYTFQCVVTKSAQTCLTNDPKQRPLFSVFDGVYNTALFAVIPVVFTGYLIPKHGGFTEGFFMEAWCTVALFSAIFTVSAIISIASKDKTEFFGTGEPVKVGFRDYLNVIKNNRAIQMLVIAAGMMKLAGITLSNATVLVLVYAIVCGNFALSGGVAAYTAIPTMLWLFFGVGFIGTKFGQKKALLFGTLGGITACVLQCVLFYVGDPTALALPGIEGFKGWTSFTVIFLFLYICMNGFNQVAMSIVIPMTADCADFEVYRSGKYVPGLMGTLFSFVDKFISSFGATLVGLLCALIGFKEKLPDINTPLTPSLKFMAVFCMFGLLIIGFIVTLAAMKFYPLTQEHMAFIQAEIAEIKKKAQEGKK